MTQHDLRSIGLRTRGVVHGPITRLISPQDIGERLKPFVFLDFFSANITPGFGFGMHPHSGIATLTWQPVAMWNTQILRVSQACLSPAGWNG